MCDNVHVPSARYSTICNVLHLSGSSLLIECIDSMINPTFEAMHKFNDHSIFHYSVFNLGL